MASTQQNYHSSSEKDGAKPTVQEPRLETGIDNFLLLLRHQLAAPLAKIGKLAAHIEELRTSGNLPTALSAEQSFNELAETSLYGAAITERLINLGTVLTGPPIACDERVLITNALHDAAQELHETTKLRNVGIRLDDGRQTLAAVYGSTYWLQLALRHLLALLINTAGPNMYVVVRLRQIGFHQLATGAISHNPLEMTTHDLVGSKRLGMKAELAAAHHVSHLDLALARAIVELHGGTLKSDVTEGGALNQFTLTLPTGEPQALRKRIDCANCLFMHQAEQFAQDIGELLNTRQTERLNYFTGNRK
jgi:signal transduction histidine kinase